VTTGVPESFREVAERLFGGDLADVQAVDLAGELAAEPARAD
jgi:hypothetical protein